MPLYLITLLFVGYNTRHLGAQLIEFANKHDTFKPFCPKGYLHIIWPIVMLTMSTADKTSTSRKDFVENGNASEDTNNVNNVEYVTPIQIIQTGNRIRDHLY